MRLLDIRRDLAGRYQLPGRTLDPRLVAIGASVLRPSASPRSRRSSGNIACTSEGDTVIPKYLMFGSTPGKYDGMRAELSS
jgi:hypothetical protein